MQGILFDLDGVLYVGESAIEGAAAVLRWVETQAIPHLFVTNTTSRPRQAIVDRLARMGVVIDIEAILTPAVAAGTWLRTHSDGPLALFVPAATRQEFSAFPHLDDTTDSGAAAVVLGDLGEDWDFATLNRAFRLLMAQPAPVFVALGLTRYWRAPQGLQLDVGPFVRALEYATGQTATVLGKPATAFFETAAARLSLPASELVMIGDDIRGDVAAAQACGMQGVLVRTGKYSARDLQQDVVPDAVLDSVATLPDWWQAHGD